MVFIVGTIIGITLCISIEFMVSKDFIVCK